MKIYLKGGAVMEVDQQTAESVYQQTIKPQTNRREAVRNEDRSGKITFFIYADQVIGIGS